MDIGSPLVLWAYRSELYWLVSVLRTSQDKALSSFVAAFRDQKIRATEASYWFFGRAKSSLIAVNISQKH